MCRFVFIWINVHFLNGTLYRKLVRNCESHRLGKMKLFTVLRGGAWESTWRFTVLGIYHFGKIDCVLGIIGLS